MKILYIFVSLAVAVKAGYHQTVGIPLAARIKAYEDKLYSEVPDMKARVVFKSAANKSQLVADENAWPFMAGLVIELKDGDVSVCGASILDKFRLVTAAHCLIDAVTVKVRVGSQYMFSQGTLYVATSFESHSRFNTQSGHEDFDIGLVRISEGIEFSEKVGSVTLPVKKSDQEVIGEWAKTAGWGLTSDIQVKDFKLNEVAVQIMSVNTCKWRFGTNRLYDMTICTDGLGGRGICAGDSGGPLVVDRDGKKVLVGVASYGDDLCEDSEPSVFTRVASYLRYINGNESG